MRPGLQPDVHQLLHLQQAGGGHRHHGQESGEVLHQQGQDAAHGGDGDRRRGRGQRAQGGQAQAAHPHQASHALLVYNSITGGLPINALLPFYLISMLNAHAQYVVTSGLNYENSSPTLDREAPKVCPKKSLANV